MHKAFYYNENKVKEGRAVLLETHLYHKSTDQLSEWEKLRRLQRLAELRPDVEKNTLHISLNFEPSEVLDDETKKAIATEYMEGIGYGKQPFLVYEHFDAGHPHMHILTTCIQRNAVRIPTHLIAEKQSAPTVKLLEKKYGLIVAAGRSQVKEQRLRPADLTKAEYGMAATRSEISRIVRPVVKHYNFTNLAELNAALLQFNVIADRGQPGTRLYEKGGLYYSLVNEAGKKSGETDQGIVHRRQAHVEGTRKPIRGKQRRPESKKGKNPNGR